MAQWKKLILSGSTAELSSLALDVALSVANGGTGQATLSSGEVLLGNGTSGVTSVARGNVTGDGSKLSVSGGTSAILGAGVSFTIGGGIASGSSLNDISDLSSADGNFIVGSATGWVAESGATVRTSLGLGTGDSPTFTNLTLTGDLTASAGIVSASAFIGDGSQLTGLPSAAINSYTNASNNRLITSVDSNTVNSEANLTFDGSVLEITGRLNASGNLTGSALMLNSLSAGTDNTVLILDSNNNVVTDEIDARVWGSTLVDGSGATNRLAFWSDSNSLSSNANLSYDGTNLSVGNSTFGEDVVINGNLTVNGDTVQQNVANLNVEDRFILLNSGSASGDGGIIVQTESGFSGAAFGWDDSATRFGLQKNTKLAHNATSITPEAYVAAVVDVDGGLSDIAAFQQNGNIRIEGGEIYIYA